MKNKFLLFSLIFLCNNAFSMFNKVKLFFDNEALRDTVLELTSKNHVLHIGNPMPEEEVWNGGKKFHLITFYLNSLYTVLEIDCFLKRKFQGIGTIVNMNRVNREYIRDQSHR